MRRYAGTLNSLGNTEEWQGASTGMFSSRYAAVILDTEVLYVSVDNGTNLYGRYVLHNKDTGATITAVTFIDGNAVGSPRDQQFLFKVDGSTAICYSHFGSNDNDMAQGRAPMRVYQTGIGWTKPTFDSHVGTYHYVTGIFKFDDATKLGVIIKSNEGDFMGYISTDKGLTWTRTAGMDKLAAWVSPGSAGLQYTVGAGGNGELVVSSKLLNSSRATSSDSDAYASYVSTDGGTTFDVIRPVNGLRSIGRIQYSSVTNSFIFCAYETFDGEVRYGVYTTPTMADLSQAELIYRVDTKSGSTVGTITAIGLGNTGIWLIESGVTGITFIPYPEATKIYIPKYQAPAGYETSVRIS